MRFFSCDSKITHIKTQVLMKGKIFRTQKSGLANTMAVNYVKYFPERPYKTCNHSKCGILGGFIFCVWIARTYNGEGPFGMFGLFGSPHNQTLDLCCRQKGHTQKVLFACLCITPTGRKTIFVFCSVRLTGKNFNRKRPHRKINDVLLKNFHSFVVPDHQGG